MFMYRADLHCHSTCSDGTSTPEELLILAKESELSAISITDHDTLDAYTDSLFEKGNAIGVKLFVGVEFSTRHEGYPIHLLGYDVQKTPEILAFCEKHQQRRLHRNRAILEKLRHLSIIIEEDELKSPKERTTGRPHIAQLLVEKGVVSTIQEAFDRFIGEGKPCFEPGESFTPEETIDVIHHSFGKAFIAHPHLVRKKSVFNDLLEMPFDGIECYYGRYHNHEKKWLRLAKEKGWLVSGGSDFHGEIKPHIRLGCSWTPKEKVQEIFGTT
ncbi:MAG: PHP domain-containing protein [Chlamydiia bacterium]|nr:PHP domain-containing protein [Chlamydiia bacterium]